MEVARALQSYLDAEVDQALAQRVGLHLEVCRRCGMKAETYRAIKSSLARAGSIDEVTRRRLEDFAHSVSRSGGQV
jgi:hypothetical protein